MKQHLTPKNVIVRFLKYYKMERSVASSVISLEALKNTIFIGCKRSFEVVS